MADPIRWRNLATNADCMVKHIRSRFALAHDVLRHSFFSYLVGTEGSVERAALEGGNTESILRRHYLNLATSNEAQGFWQILPPGAGEGTEDRGDARMTTQQSSLTSRHS